MSKKLFKAVQWIWLIALLLCPIVLWILPGDYFDHGETVLCPSRLLFDIECLGCGITRAVMHFHHLEIEDAVYYNPFVLGVYPFLIFLWGKWIYDTSRDLGLIGGEMTKEVETLKQ